MRRLAALITSLLLAGCGILRPGIPDADSGITVKKREPCEVVVTDERGSQCVSRDHAGQMLRRILN